MGYAHSFFKILQSILGVLGQGSLFVDSEQKMRETPDLANELDILEGKGKEKLPTTEVEAHDHSKVTSMEEIEEFFKQHHAQKDQEEMEEDLVDEDMREKPTKEQSTHAYTLLPQVLKYLSHRSAETRTGNGG